MTCEPIAVMLTSRFIIVTHTHTFSGPFSGTTRVSRYQKGKTNLDFTEARDSDWQWHQLGRMQVCTSLQTDNHTSTPPLIFLQSGCPSCCPTNSVKALKAQTRCQSTEGIKIHNSERASIACCRWEQCVSVVCRRCRRHAERRQA